MQTVMSVNPGVLKSLVRAFALTALVAALGACSSPKTAISTDGVDDVATGDTQLSVDVSATADGTAGTVVSTEDMSDSTGGTDAEADAIADAATDALTDSADDAADVIPDVPEVDVNPNPKGVPGATITAPATGTVIESGKPVALAGIVTDTLYSGADLKVEWASDIDGVLGTSIPDASGNVSLNLPKLSPGNHTISLSVTEPSDVGAQDTISLGICSWGTPDSFDTTVAGGKWKTYGDAYFDPGGWLEMTGNAQSKKGSIYNIADYVSPGDVQLSFKIATGGYLTNSGQPKGADGFALNVIDVKTVAELETYIATAGAGGCLGYGVTGDCKQNGVSMAIEAFHIEIDTWHNNGDPNVDPTLENHIGIMQNGDATNHYLWASVPFIEDLNWHPVTVQITGNVVRLTLDGVEIINKAIPNFKFRGGFIGFSGTTGWATNYHRFDELQILQQCIVK